jgi:UDP:flavonoid glycosyltransferase YjiC (YdhE family)
MTWLRFLLATYGSRGDVAPMLALGRALTRRGHQVVLAGPPEFAGDAAQRGVDYRPMGQSMEAFLARNSGAIHGNRLRLARVIKRDVPAEVVAQFELLTDLAREADRVVAASLVFAARSCAEHAGRPYRYIAFAPETFPSRHHPGLGERFQNLPSWFNRFSWWVTHRLDNWLLRMPINRGRARLGLPPIADALEHFADPSLGLLATDAELAPAPDDVRLPDAPTGAMLLDENGPLPEEVEAFLAAGQRPVYIGFGSMPDARPEWTRALIAEAVRRAGCRAIVYAGARAGARLDLGPDILVVGKLPHDRLFPRVALAVHHGGAGTCARAARAGIPQVILPHLLDQFPWSARLARRGLAPRPLFRRNLTSKALALRIRQALEDPAMRAAAAQLARALAGRDGAEQAAAILSAP